MRVKEDELTRGASAAPSSILREKRERGLFARNSSTEKEIIQTLKNAKFQKVLWQCAKILVNDPKNVPENW